MSITLWFILGIVITNLLFFVYWFKGYDIEYTDIFIYIACILSGPFSIALPLVALISYCIVKVIMKVDNIVEEPFLKGRNKNKKDDNNV